MATVIDKLIGKGLKFPLQTNNHSGVAYNTSIERINQSLFILFNTQKNSRLLMPEFGSDIYKYRFDPLDSILVEQMRETIYTDIDRWEPRIIINDVKFLYKPEEEHTVYISIDYTIINTEVKGNFVYPYRKDVYNIHEDTIVER